jgi:hypothetical protein
MIEKIPQHLKQHNLFGQNSSKSLVITRRRQASTILTRTCTIISSFCLSRKLNSSMTFGRSQILSERKIIKQIGFKLRVCYSCRVFCTNFFSHSTSKPSCHYFASTQTIDSFSFINTLKPSLQFSFTYDFSTLLFVEIDLLRDCEWISSSRSCFLNIMFIIASVSSSTCLYFLFCLLHLLI